MKIFFGLILVLSFSAFGLEVDEKLTVRIIKTSESRKTVMINRGTEDGLVEGDHAKFIVTAGIVARASCVKVSPSRSVWSIYRLVNADFIVNDSVMSIKITPPVKITKDESQALVQEDTPTKVTSSDASALGIPLADGAQDLDKASVEKMGDDDLKSLDEEESQIIPEKNKEFFGVVNLSALSSSTKTDTGLDSFTSSQSYYHIGLGGEYYPQKERQWYSAFSLVGALNLMKQDSQSYNGSSVTNDVTEFSIGSNWHPTKLPSVVMDFIPYLHLSLNLGKVKSSFESGTGGQSFSSSGGTQGFSGGFGYKFYTRKGFGVRALLDYYIRNEKYTSDSSAKVFNKTVTGPRLMVGLGYRF